MSYVRFVAGILLGALIAVGVLLVEPRYGVALRDLAARALPSLAEAPIRTLRDDAVVDIEDTDEGGVDHVIGPTVSIRTPNADKYDLSSRAIMLELTIDRRGNVIAAAAATGPRQFFAEAERLARTVKFVPFQRNGKPVLARVKEFYVAIFPPERRPHYRTPFPPIKDWKSLRIGLERGGCYGSCPSYSVEVHGDGTVLYEGDGFVALRGKHRATIPQQDVRRLFEDFRRAEFFWLFDEYAADITDLSAHRVTSSFDGRTRVVTDYAGQLAGMPDVVRDLEDAIDRTAGTDRWSKGNDETVPSLLAENWDFKSQSTHNTTMVRGVAAYGNANAVRELIAQGAPATTRVVEQDFAMLGVTALEVASKRGSTEIVAVLLQPGIRWDKNIVSQSLVNAAYTGNLNVVKALLMAGADRSYRAAGGETALMPASAVAIPDVVAELLSNVRWPGPDAEVNAVDDRGFTALFRVATAVAPRRNTAKIDRAAVVGILVSAGARVDHRDKEGNTPLIANYHAEVAAALIKAGANVNAQNNAGETALMTTFSPDVMLILLEAGADPHIRNGKGEDALAAARKRWNAKKTVPVLENWLADHASASTD